MNYRSAFQYFCRDYNHGCVVAFFCQGGGADRLAAPIPYMLNETQKQLYLNNHAKYILPDRTEGEGNKREAATVAVNFASMGFAMRAQDIDKLAECTKPEIIAFYREMKPMLEELNGGKYDYHPFYPNFPQEVMEKDRLEIFLDQVVYAMSGFAIRPELYEKAEEAFPFMGEVTEHPITGVTEEEYEADMQTVMCSAEPYSTGQAKEIMEYLQAHTENGRHELINEALPDPSSLKQKENGIVLGILAEKALKEVDPQNSKAALKMYVKDIPDVLRFAAARSAVNDLERENGKDYSADQYMTALHKASMQYTKAETPSFHLSRPDRTFCVQQLNKLSYGDPSRLAAQMYTHRTEWKKLFNQIHIPDIQKLHANTVVQAMSMVRNNVSIDRYARRVEEALKSDDLQTALKETKTHPGDFVRRFDKLLCMAIEKDAEQSKASGQEAHGNTDAVLDTLKDVAPKAGIATSLALAEHIANRQDEEYQRVFRSEKTSKVFTTTDKNRIPIPAAICDKTRQVVLDCLAEKFKGKGEMGKVYISPEMQNFKAPTEMRTQNEGMDVNTLGTTKDINPDKDILRLFIGWQNTERGDRVDIDLSAQMIDQEGKVQHIGWDDMYDDGDHLCVYSGDVQDGRDRESASDCACEYIDVDLRGMEQKGVQYIICSANVFCIDDWSDNTPETFDSIPFCDFGYMLRNRDDEGKLMEVAAIESRMHMQQHTRSCVPLVYDVQNQRIIFVNQTMDKEQNVASRSIKDMINYLPVIISKADNSLTMDELIRANAKNCGQIVDDPAKADIAFMSNREAQSYMEEHGEHSLDNVELHYANDFAYATGVLMADPAPHKDLFHLHEREERQPDPGTRQEQLAYDRDEFDDLNFEHEF